MNRIWKVIMLSVLLGIASATVVHAENTIKFGEYPQTRVDSESNLYNALVKLSNITESKILKYEDEKYLDTDSGFYKYEPISWVKISGNNSRALLISQYVLDNHSYGTINDMCVSWNSSDLRNWCNTDFLETAFTSAEQGCIYLTNVSSCDWGKENSMLTSEKITLPSDEIVKSLSESLRQGVGTDYSGTGKHNYYTRCTDSYYGVWNLPIWVTSSSDYNSSYPANWSRGIRPCIILNLSVAETVEKQQAEEKEKAKIKDISKGVVTLSATTYKYDGKAKTPSVTVKYDGKTLSSADYSVSYKNNRYVGTASLEITGKGNYTGTVKKTFSITAGKQIKVTFNGNTGTVSKNQINVKLGAKYGTLPTAKKKGYKFTGWFTEKNGGKKITKDSYVETNKNQTLYAQWKKETYSITYKLNGGANSKKNPKSYTVTTKTVSLANPSRKGYVFKGWYIDRKYKKSISKISQGSTGAKTLYAKWAAITYSVEFDGNGVLNGKMSSMMSLKYGVCYKLKKNTYKAPTGKQFKEWNTKKDGSGKSFKNEEIFSNFTTKNGAKIKLYAQWELVRYKIKYVLNGGTNNSKNVTSFNTKEKKEIKNGSRTGYTFAGWYVRADLTGKGVTNVNQLSAKNITLYAKWKPITYTLHFDGNDWLTDIPKDISCKYDATSVIPLVHNNLFGGWTTNKDGTGKRYTGGEKVKNLLSSSGTITFYAQKSETKVIVTNYSAGVSFGKIRYVYQLGDYVANGWGKYASNAGKGGDGDPRAECGFASQSMALSYIGKDISPEWLCERVTTYFSSYCYGISGVSATTGSNLVSGSAAYQTMNTMLDNFIKDGNKGIYSPVIIHYHNGSNQHTILVVGRNIDGSYMVLDTAKSSSVYSLRITVDGVISSRQGAIHDGGAIDAVQQYRRN